MLPALCLRSPNTTPAPGIGKESHTNPKHFGVNYAFQVPIATKYRYVITKVPFYMLITCLKRVFLQHLRSTHSNDLRYVVVFVLVDLVICFYSCRLQKATKTPTEIQNRIV